MPDRPRSIRVTTDASGTASGAVDYDVRGNIRSGSSGQIGWEGELRDDATGQVHLRARDYSPGTGRFTSRDSLIPNAPGTQGYNPYWYANDNPATLTDPSGHAAAAALPANCGICTPALPAAIAPYVAAQAALAASAARDLRTFVGQRKWTIAAFAVVGALFGCLISPSCHANVGVVTGGLIREVEEAKRDFNNLISAIVLIMAATVATSIERVRVRDRVREGCTFSYPYRASNFRRNLACLTEGTKWGPFGFDAHHVFPKKFEVRFDSILGIDAIHEPRYGQWWFFLFHRGTSAAYNRRWQDFFATRTLINPPTYVETLERGRWIMAQFGLAVLY